MLVLSRHKQEAIVIDLRQFGLGLVRVVPVAIRGNVVRLGFEADGKVPVHRQEVFDSIEHQRPAA